MNFLKRRFSDLGPNLLDTIASSTQEVINQVNNPAGSGAPSASANPQQTSQAGVAGQQQYPHQNNPSHQVPAQYRQQQQQQAPHYPPSGGSNPPPHSQHNFQHPPTTQPRSDLSKPGIIIKHAVQNN